MSIIKPNTPMISQGQEFYPLTHASQIIKSDGTRLEQDGKIIIDGATGGGGAVDSVNGQTGEVVLSASDVGALSTAGGTATGSLWVNTEGEGDIGVQYAAGKFLYLYGNKANGTRGIYDSEQGSVFSVTSGGKLFNGTAVAAQTAHALASGAMMLTPCGSWSGEIAASGYTSTLSITPTTRSGFTFLGPVSWGSNSSYISVYGLYYYSSMIRLYMRNLKNSAITPTVELYGLYIKN